MRASRFGRLRRVVATSSSIIGTMKPERVAQCRNAVGVYIVVWGTGLIKLNVETGRTRQARSVSSARAATASSVFNVERRPSRR